MRKLTKGSKKGTGRGAKSRIGRTGHVRKMKVSSGRGS